MTLVRRGRFDLNQPGIHGCLTVGKVYTATVKERAILAAAVDLLGERGVDGATTAEIAKRADVTERTLFRYFPSKRDLVRRVLAPTILRTILPS